MTVQSIIDLVKADGDSWGFIIFILMTSIQISPVKVNPWSSIANWIGKQINKEVIDKVDSLEGQIKSIDDKLNSHINEAIEAEVQQWRAMILDFASAVLSGQNFHQEKFEFMISKCDLYEQHCIKYNIPNGVATASIAEIRSTYQKRLRENSFLS